MSVQAVLSDELIAAFLEDRCDASMLPEPGWGPLGKQTFERSYSRPIFLLDPKQPHDPVTGSPRFELDADGNAVLQSWWKWSRPADGRHAETWADTCRRVVLGSLGFVPSLVHDVKERLELFRAMFFFEFLPAGRHLWATGVHASVRNCFRAGWAPELAEHFEFHGARLFEGGGVGANYSNDYLARTAGVVRPVEAWFYCDPSHEDFEAVKAAAGDRWVAKPSMSGWSRMMVHEVDDSREGWVAAWGQVFRLSTDPADAGIDGIVFDVSSIRPYGAVLKTFGGTASGPAPFVEAAAKIAATVSGALGRHLRSIEAMECDHAIAEAVCAGGTRRSARMAMKHWADDDIDEFVVCKADEVSHWSTNISVEVDDAFFVALDAGDSHARSVLDSVVNGMLSNGEPGFYNSSLAGRFEDGDVRCTNPCGEVPLNEKESCNIGSVNLSRLGNDFGRAVSLFALAARFLYRATFTEIADPTQRALEARNRRIGVGFMGLQEWCIDQGFRLSDLPKQFDAIQQLVSFRGAARQAADRMAMQLGTPKPVKVTAVAPTGSIALLPGAQPSFEAVLARYFIRRIRYQTSDPKLLDFAADGYTVVEDVYSANTMVVEFPTKHAILDRVASSAIDRACARLLGEVAVDDHARREALSVIASVLSGAEDVATADLSEVRERLGASDAAAADLFELACEVAGDAVEVFREAAVRAVDLVEEMADIDPAAFLEVQAVVTEAFCGGSDGNAVSATLNLPASFAVRGQSVDEARAAAFAEMVREVLPRLKGMTVFPAESRPLLPIEAISKAQYVELRDRLFDAQVVLLSGDSNDGSCASGACPVR